MRQAGCITREALVQRLDRYRVIFLGDHHLSDSLHREQAALLDALGQGGRHVLLANEWFTPQDNALLAHYADGTYEGNFTAEIGWEKKAGYPFSSYAPLYESVRKNEGRLLGVNMDKAFQKALSENNLTAFTEEQRTFYEGLDMNLTAHRTLLAPFFSRCHAKKPGEDEAACLERMYRVQVAWDSFMGAQSARIAAARLKSPDDVLVVFAGAMHLAYGVGINARFARLSDEPFITILPVPEGTPSADIGEADFLLFYPDADTEGGRK